MLFGQPAMPPRQAIATFLTEIVERSLESRLGCLLANAALEVAPHDPDIADVVVEHIGGLETFCRRCVSACAAHTAPAAMIRPNIVRRRIGSRNSPAREGGFRRRLAQFARTNRGFDHAGEIFRDPFANL